MNTTLAAPRARRFGIVGVIAAILLPAAASAQFDLPWYTLDGGGAMFTTGGVYTLSGTIGQPDAGPVMTGGTYRLSGGFWPGATGGGCLGDLDGDGAVGLGDLTILLSNFGTVGGVDPDDGDLDNDDDVDLTDLTLMLSIFGTFC